jgi:hypothetical protein
MRGMFVLSVPHALLWIALFEEVSEALTASGLFIIVRIGIPIATVVLNLRHSTVQSCVPSLSSNQGMLSHQPMLFMLMLCFSSYSFTFLYHLQSKTEFQHGCFAARSKVRLLFLLDSCMMPLPVCILAYIYLLLCD